MTHPEELEPLVEGVPWVVTRHGRTHKCQLGSLVFMVEKSVHWWGKCYPIDTPTDALFWADTKRTAKEVRDQLFAKKNELIRALGGVPVEQKVSEL